MDCRDVLGDRLATQVPFVRAWVGIVGADKLDTAEAASDDAEVSDKDGVSLRPSCSSDCCLG